MNPEDVKIGQKYLYITVTGRIAVVTPKRQLKSGQFSCEEGCRVSALFLEVPSHLR